MWVPAPVYERIPQFWFLLGLLFMASGVFLGFEYGLSFVYIGVGLACCGWSAWILVTRLRPRTDDQAAFSAPQDGDAQRPAEEGVVQA